MTSSVIHVIDDDPAIRDSLVVRLACEGWDVITYDSALHFLAQPAPTTGCILSDIRMPGMTGLELQEALNQKEVRLPMILMTGEADVPLAVRAMRAGAIDFLEKPFPEDRLIEAVRRGLQLASERRTAELTREMSQSKLKRLTARERQVLDLLVLGRSNKEIALEFGTSPRTIDVQRARVFEKLEVHSLPDLVYLHLSADER